jgi:hypothetical protein
MGRNSGKASPVDRASDRLATKRKRRSSPASGENLE